MSERPIQPMTEKEMRNVRATISAMQHPNQLGMHADWWIKWQRFSLWLYDLEDEYNKEADKKFSESAALRSRIAELDAHNAVLVERIKLLEYEKKGDK